MYLENYDNLDNLHKSPEFSRHSNTPKHRVPALQSRLRVRHLSRTYAVKIINSFVVYLLLRYSLKQTAYGLPCVSQQLEGPQCDLLGELSSKNHENKKRNSCISLALLLHNTVCLICIVFVCNMHLVVFTQNLHNINVNYHYQITESQFQD